MSKRKPTEFVHHPVSYSQALNDGGHRGVVHHVIDGDTYDIMVDYGFNEYGYKTFRLLGLDTPEIRGPEKEAGKWIAAHVENLLLINPHVTVYTTPDVQTFGRYVATIWVHRYGDNDGFNLADWIVRKMEDYDG